jgi:hypothetical protein
VTPVTTVSRLGSMLRDFAVTAYCIVGVGLAAQGLRYFVASQYMHYHADVIQEQWTELKPNEQRLMLGLLKGFGAGMLCLGLTLAFVALGPFRDGAYMAHWFLAVSAISYTALLVHITRFALLPGAAPIVVTKTMCGLSIAAALAGWV